MIKTLTIVAVAALIGVSAQAQAPSQYRTTHATNALVTVIQSNITRTNLVVFTTAAKRRYTKLTFQNGSTNPVYLVCITGNSTNFVGGQTNSVKAAGGIRLSPLGSVGDRHTYDDSIPNNGTVSGASSASWAAQVGDGDPAITGTLIVEGLGF